LTVKADFIVEEYLDVLLVPNWALRIDRNTGKVYASVRDADGVREVEVEIGVRGTSSSQVVSGLSDGDEVAVSLARQDLLDTFIEENR
jgi:multidrug efflux pump subunit AcrA (membrane-fusion protein)